MKPHKHAEVIKAWADGHTIQLKRHDGWIDEIEPSWNPVFNYRIKPKEPVVRWLWAYESKSEEKWGEHWAFLTEDEAEEFFGKNLKTKYRKLNWSRQEFDE